MKGEILDIETTKKLARLDKAIKYIEDKIKKSFEYDYGINSARCSKDRLFTETVIELQIIKDMLKGSDK